MPMVQAALYQLVLDRKVGELRAAGGRLADRLRQPGERPGRWCTACRPRSPPVSSTWRSGWTRRDWLAWGAANGIAPEVLFYIQMRPDLLHAFDPQAKEKAFCCPRTWEIVSNVVNQRGNLDSTGGARPLPGYRGRGRGGGVLGLPQGLARAAPSPGRPRRSRERGRAGQCERADRALRLALPAWPTTSRWPRSSPTPSACAARSASSWSGPASGAIPTFSARPPSSAGPPPARSSNPIGRIAP